jgi:predicted nucleic acid-binding protein
MKTFFDTNVLVYMLSDRDPAYQQQAATRFEQALRQGKIALSTQVLHELVNVMTHKHKPVLTFAQANERLKPFLEFEIVGSSAGSVQAALALAQEHKISWWDALILEAALRADADVLVSEDGQHGRRFGKLVVENPFA